jgi:hypothetical protein
VLLTDSTTCRSGLQEALSRTGFLSRAGRVQQFDTGVGERGFELPAVVVLVGH